MVIRGTVESRWSPTPNLVYRKGVLINSNDIQYQNNSPRSSPTQSWGYCESINSEGAGAAGRRRRESLTAATVAATTTTRTVGNALESSSRDLASVVANRRRSYADPHPNAAAAPRRISQASYNSKGLELQHQPEHPQLMPAIGQVSTRTSGGISSIVQQRPCPPSAVNFQQQPLSTSPLQFPRTMANTSEQLRGGQAVVNNCASNIIINNNNNSSSKPKEFIPSFVLVDACKANNERKIRDLVRRLTPYSGEDVDPIVNFQDSCGRTALSYGCSSGNVMIIDELSKLRRLDPNLGDNENNTPLHYAAQAGHSETVDLLLSRFEGVIDPNCRNSTGLTPLMKAALQGRTRCAKSLISAGASANLRDYSRGMTAAEWARLCGRHICAEVIIRCAKDNYQDPHSPDFPRPQSHHNHHHHPRGLPVSQSALELKKLGSEESAAYYHQLYAARSTISGASWLKNKIKKALGASTSSGSSTSNMRDSTSSSNTTKTSNNNYEGPRRESFALLANLTGPTICASSLLLPSIKPFIDQQKPRLGRKLTIPVLQVTPVKR